MEMQRITLRPIGWKMAARRTLLQMGDDQIANEVIHGLDWDTDWNVKMVNAMGVYYARCGRRKEALEWLRKICVSNSPGLLDKWLLPVIGWTDLGRGRRNMWSTSIDVLIEIGDYSFLKAHAATVPNSFPFPRDLPSSSL